MRQNGTEKTTSFTHGLFAALSPIATSPTLSQGARRWPHPVWSLYHDGLKSPHTYLDRCRWTTSLPAEGRLLEIRMLGHTPVFLHRIDRLH